MGLKTDIFSTLKQVLLLSEEFERFKKNDEQMLSVLKDLTERLIRLEERVSILRADVKTDIVKSAENESLLAQVKELTKRLYIIEKTLVILKPVPVGDVYDKEIKIPTLPARKRK